MPVTAHPARAARKTRELFTIGYEGRAPLDLVKALVAAKVEVLLDVRERAQSRKPGFSKSALAEALTRAGVVYEHVPELGSPRALRVAGRETGDFVTFMKGYRKHLDGQAEHLDRVAQLVTTRRVCLLCFERESTMCHRSEVASRLGGALCLPITNL